MRVAAGDPLDEVVLTSYAIGAAHMALGWVLTEGIAVDPDTGEVHDLTIRSFGIIRAKDMPPVHVEIVDDPGAPLGGASDAVFAAVAAATWNAVSAADGERPVSFPAADPRRAGATPRRGGRSLPVPRTIMMLTTSIQSMNADERDEPEAEVLVAGRRRGRAGEHGDQRDERADPSERDLGNTPVRRMTAENAPTKTAMPTTVPAPMFVAMM